jgi:hypothetical protein
MMFTQAMHGRLEDEVAAIAGHLPADVIFSFTYFDPF